MSMGFGVIFLFGLLACSSRGEAVIQAGEILRLVSVTTGKLRYSSGEVIAVTLVNRHSSPIYAPPPGLAYCSVVSLEALQAGVWVSRGSCDIGVTAPIILLDTNTIMTAALFIGEQNTGSRKSRPAVPVAPAVPEEKIKPQSFAKQGDLTPVFPEGIINVKGLLYPAVNRPLVSGTYRILFVFTMGAPSGPTVNIYSEPFHIVG